MRFLTLLPVPNHATMAHHTSLLDAAESPAVGERSHNASIVEPSQRRQKHYGTNSGFQAYDRRASEARTASERAIRVYQFRGSDLRVRFPLALPEVPSIAVIPDLRANSGILENDAATNRRLSHATMCLRPLGSVRRLRMRGHRSLSRRNVRR
jgi:hypothetical protein